MQRHNRIAAGQDDVRPECDQFRCVSTTALGIAGTPAVVDPQIAVLGPAELLQAICERYQTGLSFRAVCGHAHEHSDTPHSLALLRARCERPPHRRAAEQRDELAASDESCHLIPPDGRLGKDSTLVSPCPAHGRGAGQSEGVRNNHRPPAAGVSTAARRVGATVALGPRSKQAAPASPSRVRGGHHREKFRCLTRSAVSPGAAAHSDDEATPCDDDARVLERRAR